MGIIALPMQIDTSIADMINAARGGVLNLKAVQNHLALDYAMVKKLDRLASVVDMSCASIFVEIHNEAPSVRVTYDPVAMDAQSSPTHGVFVNHEDVISFSVPFKAIQKTAPRTGHCVYMIYPMSLEKKAAISPSNMIPQFLMPDGYNGRLPFEAAIKNRLPIYIGKTSRGVAVRAKEHLAAAINNPLTRFHRAISGSPKYEPMSMNVMLFSTHDNEEMAYRSEEAEIKKASELQDVYLLNTMFSRQALHELLKLHPSAKNVAAEDAEEALARRSSLSSSRWNDPAYAEAVICNNERNFSADDVKHIRMLHLLGSDYNAISRAISAPSSRIKKLLSGFTYRRVL